MRKANEKSRFLNFPVQLLSGFLTNKEYVLENILDYAVYVKAQSLKSYSELKNGKEALAYFKINGQDPQITLDVGKLLYELLPKKSPMVGLNTAIWLKYYKDEKTEFEDISFLAFLALKSILGRKTHCKVNNKYWLARMDGKPCSIENYNELSPEIYKYSTEYQTVKIKKALEDSWGLTTYSFHTRGFYVSFELTLEELVYQAEKLKQSNKDREYQAHKKEAREKAYDRLKA